MSEFIRNLIKHHLIHVLGEPPGQTHLIATVGHSDDSQDERKSKILTSITSGIFVPEKLIEGDADIWGVTLIRQPRSDVILLCEIVQPVELMMNNYIRRCTPLDVPPHRLPSWLVWEAL